MLREEEQKIKETDNDLTNNEKILLNFLNYFKDKRKIIYFSNIAISILGISYHKNTIFIIGGQLFIIGLFVDTAGLIFKILKSRIFNLIEMVVLLAICTYFFANLGFFFLNENMISTLTSEAPENGRGHKQ